MKIAPEHPIVNLWRAYLDEHNSEKFLQKCLQASPGFVFPHRKETALVLGHFSQTQKHWKLNYYIALIYLNYGLKERATKYLNACGNEPDFAPFWLVKAKWVNNKNDRFKCLQKATELAPSDWRPSFELVGFYLENGELSKALEMTSRLTGKFKEQAAIGIAHARGLIALEKYNEAISFLEDYEVLPFEGATVGRDIYHEACLRKAFKAFKTEDYKQVIKYAEKAKNWLLNLGVGRPYDVDERMEDFLLAMTFDKLENREKAEIFKQKVADYSHPAYNQENSRLYLQLIILKQNGREEEAMKLLRQHKSDYPENIYIQWVNAKFEGKTDAERIKEKALESDVDIQPYDTKFIDKKFALLIDLLSMIR